MNQEASVPAGNGHVAAESQSFDSGLLDALRNILEGTAPTVGEEFFRALVKHLAQALNVSLAFVAEFASSNIRVRTLACWDEGHFQPNVEYSLEGTPCQEVLGGRLCHHPRGIQQLFPVDQALVDLRLESYLGVPLVDSRGQVLGHLAVSDRREMELDERRLFMLRIFASRAAAELQRLRAEQQVRESEQRFRDLYEEAPIAYVMEDLESRFISANRAAMRILGITADQVPGTVGKSFIPNTPDAQRRVQEAFASIGRGTDTAGVVLELRRRDDQQPIWIQWWSRPEPGGQFTRTMFVDITDKVLIEQEKNRLTAQNLYLQEEIKSVHNFEEIIGQSPALLAVLENVSRVAQTDASVLITGETGTGKELVARAIHSHSRRRDKPLIKINCAALPAALVESELFGHEKGAFTGALARRLGRFELAAGGTIFLDEIGEMPIDVQAKLLRVLQEREFERVGGAETIPVDVRIIAATNRDLRKAIAEKAFRADLFFRLNVFPIHLPPLRERTSDIPLLTAFLLERFSQRVGRTFSGIEPGSLARLVAYPWPGNVRELENIVERAVILSPGKLVEVPPEMVHLAEGFVVPAREMFLPPATERAAEALAATGQVPTDLKSVERSHIEQALRQSGWVIEGLRGAARILGLHPNTLRSRIKKLGITRPERREA